ncbi:hypothetical protein [Fuerstiella marisgermanici]|uniref:Uncharacterized protein n=1 Tax=Fuerstiella marisgermanici TaxID=1891926 RepID=A0A1P8WIR5_9PLAN|nr:hypothetical protein [Fuerstiella marisgermanici]APZ93962.1 hypothetical protein Fuma_03580 [Fuerstiella marisgermanici]
MWCPHCQSETNAVGSGLSEKLRCESCGKAFISSKPSDSSIRQARDIIARWSSDDLLDRITSLPDIPAMPKPHFAIEQREQHGERSAENNEQRASDVNPSGKQTQADGPAPPAAEPTATDEQNNSVDDQQDSTQGLMEESDRISDEPTRDQQITDDSPAMAPVASTNEDTAPKTDAAIEQTPVVSTPRKPEETQEPVANTSATAKSALSVEELSQQFGLTAAQPKFFPASAPHNAAKTADATESAPEPDQKPAEPISPPPQQESNTPVAAEESELAEVPEASEEKADTALQIAAPDEPETSQAEVSQPESSQPELQDDTPEDTSSAPSTIQPEPVVVPLVQKQRRTQRRVPQRRQQQPRRSTETNSDKGPATVSRKLRVDSNSELEPETTDDEAQSVSGSRIQSNSPTGGRRFRIDDSEDVQQTLGTSDGRTRTDSRHRDRFIDEAHDTALRGPHFQVTAPKRSNMTSLTGQFLAYLGVLGLTIGTAMVIYGHFGGYSEYTPTGWLVTTVAQMMLFLGVINLVSGGIEQNNDDVSARINNLGEQLMRIEYVTEQALRGPKISAHRYADPSAPIERSERETVTVGKRTS